MPLRAKLATTLLRCAAALSRAAGRGDGSVIGGRVGLAVEPQLLALLARGREVVLVSGTNGKTTTTRFVAAALGARGDVATNSFGANMPTGHTTALAQSTTAPFAVLEVDEHYLRGVLGQTTPQVVTLLNLSRDQMDRAMEVGMMAEAWRSALDGVDTHVIANCDDPMIVWAASTSKDVTWVSAGQRWQEDSFVCPSCGGHLDRADGSWSCRGCDLSRPTPSWTLDAKGGVIAPDGTRHVPTLQLPGRVNVANAMTALAVAGHFDVTPEQALGRLAQVASIAGRYATVTRGDQVIRLLLAKNPAGWLEALDMVEPDCPVLLSINARDPDGLDTSWLYDVDYTVLRGRRVLVAGDRAYDMCVRLSVDEVEFTHVRNFTAALTAMGNGRLEVVANYTAFQDIRADLNRVN
ncbi:MAG: DUF1727 domain-containing protein [Longispora sp.]|nr:DUF1727 domain-containing protein [Longispora sp. (in: high G+C Gram-positive bacteria)]